MHMRICFGLVKASMVSDQQSCFEVLKSRERYSHWNDRFWEYRSCRGDASFTHNWKNNSRKKLMVVKLEGSSQYEDKLQGKKVVRLPGVLELKQKCDYLPNKISRHTWTAVGIVSLSLLYPIRCYGAHKDRKKSIMWLQLRIMCRDT